MQITEFGKTMSLIHQARTALARRTKNMQWRSLLFMAPVS